MKLLTAFLTLTLAVALTLAAIAATRLDPKLALPAAIVAAGSLFGLWGFPT